MISVQLFFVAILGFVNINKGNCIKVTQHSLAYEIGPLAMADSTASCYFLRIPKGKTDSIRMTHSTNSGPEIRLNIYRMLLLPTTMLSMYPLDKEEDEWSDIDMDDDMAPALVEDGVPPIIELEDDEDSDDTDTVMDDGMAMTYINAAETEGYTGQDYEPRYPTILRVNKQIYEEASSLLYTEGVLVVEPSDIFALGENPEDLDFGAPSEDVWRYHPIKDPGVVGKDGNFTYHAKDGEFTEEGKMFPHVFRRFQRITFNANFDYEQTQNVELWIDDTTHVVREDTVDDFKAMLKTSPIMKDFVALVSTSPKIVTLEVALEVEVMANSELMMQDLDEDDMDEDAEEEMEMKIDTLMEKGNERATEIFLDSGVCDVLGTLKNVESFDVGFAFIRDEGDKYMPSEGHVKLLKELKEKVEGNYAKA